MARDNNGYYNVGGLATEHSAAIILLIVLAFLIFVRWGFSGIGFSSSLSAAVRV